MPRRLPNDRQDPSSRAIDAKGRHSDETSRLPFPPVPPASHAPLLSLSLSCSLAPLVSSRFPCTTHPLLIHDWPPLLLHSTSGSSAPEAHTHIRSKDCRTGKRQVICWRNADDSASRSSRFAKCSPSRLAPGFPSHSYTRTRHPLLHRLPIHAAAQLLLMAKVLDTETSWTETSVSSRSPVSSPAPVIPTSNSLKFSIESLLTSRKQHLPREPLTSKETVDRHTTSSPAPRESRCEGSSPRDSSCSGQEDEEEEEEEPMGQSSRQPATTAASSFPHGFSLMQVPVSLAPGAASTGLFSSRVPSWPVDRSHSLHHPPHHALTPFLGWIRASHHHRPISPSVMSKRNCSHAVS